jgi:hypothetical protein
MVRQSHHRRSSLNLHRLVPEQHLTLILDGVLGPILRGHVPSLKALIVSLGVNDGRGNIRVY